ncbi:hypothetical protein Vadar_024796 [Vaccinium darrowii]|uniref:Uncharacterized protein n=1 Tax=Vaccinium darrowii TaxID=229202 RepID=A0ACB7YQG1_9ERIC|nr:hypothetical protein Vadar_024796 [Vaccinium darrowii]
MSQSKMMDEVDDGSASIGRSRRSRIRTRECDTSHCKETSLDAQAKSLSEIRGGGILLFDACGQKKKKLIAARDELTGRSPCSNPLDLGHDSEENVYLLCKKLRTSGLADADGSDLYVVFISNEKKQVPLWHQKTSHRADGVILWDYHVICVQRKKESGSSPLVWDLDSSLPFPSSLASYVSATIRPSFQIFADFQRFFCVVHAPIFLRSFASDRRHMKDSLGKWIAKPPAYGPIVAEGKFKKQFDYKFMLT